MQILEKQRDVFRAAVYSSPRQIVSGRLSKASGLMLEAKGLSLPLGASCQLDMAHGESAEAEVVGFSESGVMLMPLEPIHGARPGTPVSFQIMAGGRPKPRTIPVGMGMLGRIVDGIGRPIDGKGPLNFEARVPLHGPSPNPLLRKPVNKVLDVGVRAINSVLPIGEGQRVGLFAGSGVGKSVLLGMMARYTDADVVVVGLIGERGREVTEFIEDSLGADGLARSVLVVATADTGPLMRLHGAACATAMAEYYRDQGLKVLLIMDSLTRYAMAQREIALAAGEPPATKGYPPSVFAKLPALVERAGNGEHGKGSITAFYTVLSEGDDQQDPVADSARAVLDGHFVLTRKLAEVGHFPALDIGQSASRVIGNLLSASEMEETRRFKSLYSTYQENRDIVMVGAYRAGTNSVLDEAIAKHDAIMGFLRQGMRETCSVSDSRTQMRHILST